MERGSAKTSITQGEYAQLLGLRLLADKHNEMLKDIHKAALLITAELDRDGVPENSDGLGHTGDWMYGSRTTDELLRLLGLAVEEPTNSKPQEFRAG